MVESQHEVYGESTRVTSCGLPRNNRNHRRKREILVEATDATPRDAVLEVGCGDGLHASYYDQHFAAFTAVDLSLSLTRETAARIDSPVLQADATALPFDDNTFDAVLGTAILHHLPDAEAALREWCRVAMTSVTVIEPNYLFPLAFVTAHLLPEERHKRQLTPWNVRRIASSISDDYTVAPCLYTPPWPEVLTPAYSAADRTLQRVPGLRWAGQMLLIHVRP